MKISKLLANLICDETGGEVVEYAVIGGMVLFAALGVVGSFGGKALARWGSVNGSM